MRAVTGALVVTALLLPSTSWASTTDRDEQIAAMPERAWPQSITEFRPGITEFKPSITEFGPSITQVEDRTTEAGETVVALSSDILFAFDKADISDVAATKIRELVTDIPRGDKVTVGGHTDALGSDERNDELSLERAEAVATVIAQARPDLELDVQGFGPDQPVEPNEVDGEDNPQGRAKNRRVEIRFAD